MAEVSVSVILPATESSLVVWHEGGTAQLNVLSTCTSEPPKKEAVLFCCAKTTFPETVVTVSIN